MAVAAEQTVKLLLHYRVAFTQYCFQTLPVENTDVAASVFDQALFRLRPLSLLRFMVEPLKPASHIDLSSIGASVSVQTKSLLLTIIRLFHQYKMSAGSALEFGGANLLSTLPTRRFIY